MELHKPVPFETSALPTSPLKDLSENLLLVLATPLIGLLINLKSAEPENTRESLNDMILQIFQHFNQKAERSGYSARTILAAQYCLCTALDEVIMSTKWGRENRWRDQSLLSTLYKETFGGERFYIILENMLSNPQENVDLLGLIYVLLSLGFKGKYYNQDPLVLAALRNDLFIKITPFLPREEKKYLREVSSELEKKEKKIAIPLWVVLVFTILFVLTVMSIHDYSINRAVVPISNFLQEIYDLPYNQGSKYEKNS